MLSTEQRGGQEAEGRESNLQALYFLLGVSRSRFRPTTLRQDSLKLCLMCPNHNFVGDRATADCRLPQVGPAATCVAPLV